MGAMEEFIHYEKLIIFKRQLADPSITDERRRMLARLLALALQSLFCFEVSALSGSLVSSPPARPCDEVCGLYTLSSESDGDAANFLD